MSEMDDLIINLGHADHAIAPSFTMREQQFEDESEKGEATCNIAPSKLHLFFFYFATGCFWYAYGKPESSRILFYFSDYAEIYLP